jgi:hypothetical protein
VSPASLSFGNVAVGQEPTMTVSITNKGNATLNVTGINTASQFAASGKPSMLPLNRFF